MINNVLIDSQRAKEDNNDDLLFYSNARFVNHLDQGFRSKLSCLYRQKIDPSSVILDLMSSWNSHLPEDVTYGRVIGHGLNYSELEKNIRLDSFWVQNLNTNQQLPLDDCSIDVCLIVASWQYLQYPEAVSLEVNRVVKPNGKIIVSFSNRAFWTKATRVWLDSNDKERIDYIIQVLSSNGWTFDEKIIDYNSRDNILSLLGFSSDPFFSVIATK